MAIDRRRFLALGAALGLGHIPVAALAAEAERAAEAARTGGARYLSARKRGGRDETALLDESGRDLRVVPMPARGHSFAIDAAGGRAVVFGRQPGFFALGFGLDGAAGPVELDLPQDRHFFGHGAFFDDGRLLAATENDFDGGRGVLGIYDASAGGAYRRVGEFDCGGIGPHEVLLLPDGKTLCVANGGILTHPDYGKLELNLDTMRPSLAYLDAASGKLLERVELDPALHRLSIRHLAVAADGAVWFGCQYMGPAGDRPALVGRHRRGQAPELFPGPGMPCARCATTSARSRWTRPARWWPRPAPWAGRSCTGTRPADAAWARPPWRTAAAWRRPAPAASWSAAAWAPCCARMRAGRNGRCCRLHRTCPGTIISGACRTWRLPGILTKLDTGSPRPRQGAMVF